MNKYFLLLIVVFSFVTPTNSVYAENDSPTPLVETFHSALIDVMTHADALGFQGRYDKLDPVISSSFYFPLMMQIATGGHWKKATAAQQSAMSNAFHKISTSTYAARFDGFSGQTFKTLEEIPGPQKTTLVKTLLVNPGGDNVELVYVTRKIKDRWQIFDVLLDGGISEIAVRRSEYRRILKAGGVDKLITLLDQQAKNLKK